MKNILMTVTAVVLMTLSVQAQAQFGALKQTADTYTKAATDVVAPADVSQEAIVQSYVQSNIAVLNAQAKFADAFNDKKGAATARATADSLQSGSTEMDKKALKSNFEVTDTLVAASQAWLDSGAELSAEGRESYVEGLALAVVSVLSTKAMAADATEFATSAQNDIKSGSMMQRAKLVKKFAAGMFVANELPGFTTRLTQNLTSLMAYAKSADIPTPDDDGATEALAAL